MKRKGLYPQMKSDKKKIQPDGIFNLDDMIELVYFFANIYLGRLSAFQHNSNLTVSLGRSRSLTFSASPCLDNFIKADDKMAAY